MFREKRTPGRSSPRMEALEGTGITFEGISMDQLSLQNPVFATYVISATLMILKAVSMSWLTVARMMQVRGGFRSP